MGTSGFVGLKPIKEMATMIKFRAWEDRGKEYIEDVLIGSDGKVYFDDGVATQDDLDISVERFTGLKDVNGKDIYEGDLVRLADDLDNPYKVIFDKAKFEFSGSRFCYDFGEAFMDYEVIGNVHANPELLEAKNEESI